MKLGLLLVKLQRVLIPIFFLTIFWQTRISLFNAHEIYDYLIPFVYLSDVFIFILIGLEFWSQPGWLQLLWHEYKTWIVIVAGFVIVIVVTLIDAPHQIGGYYKLFKLIELVFFMLWTTRLVRRVSWEIVVGWVCWGLVPLVLLGVVEVVAGRSLGLSIIGEWNFSIYNPAIAKVALFGQSYMRPYSTFPHPNVFGGIVVAVGLAWVVLGSRQRLDFQRFSQPAIIGVLFLGAVLSFSRSAWIALLVTAAYLAIRFRVNLVNLRCRVGVFVAIVVIGVFVLLVLNQVGLLFGRDYLSIERRMELNRIALLAWQSFPVFGVGLNQIFFYVDRYWDLSSLTRFVQPTHNIFLLWLAEQGIVGLGFIGWLFIYPIVKFWQRIDVSIQAIWIVILITAMMDHYWWTLQAGQLLFFLTLGMTMAYHKTNE